MNVLKNFKKHIILIAIIIFCILFFTSSQNEGFQTNKNVYIFYHIFCNKDTHKIVQDQIGKILFSGLYNKVTQIKCFLVGEQTYIEQIQTIINNSGKKFKIEEIGVNDTTYERFTLLKIKKYISPDDVFLYIHSKGINRIDNPNIYYWRTLLEYFLFVKYKDCLDLLTQYDVVGLPYFKRSIGPHFSGNFWWANASYYLNLPESIDADYYAPGAYLFKNNPTYKDMSDIIDKPIVDTPDGFIDLYTIPIYPKSYVDL